MRRVLNGSSSKWHREEFSRDFPGGLVIKAVPFQCWGQGVDSISGRGTDPTCLVVQPERKKKRRGWVGSWRWNVECSRVRTRELETKG